MKPITHELKFEHIFRLVCYGEFTESHKVRDNVMIIQMDEVKMNQLMKIRGKV